jgi:hypothetical protein
MDGYIDENGLYTKAGYRFGNHAISLSHGTHDDVYDSEMDGESTAIAYQFNGPSGVDVYAAYQMLKLDTNN